MPRARVRRPRDPRSTSRSASIVPSCTRTARRRTVATSADSIAAPVASPPTCRMRARECAASRPRSRPESPRSNATPKRMRSRTRAGPSSQSTRTAAGSESPAPAAIVSVKWRSTESSGNSAAAMPPWAWRVLPSASSAFVTSSTVCPASAAFTAVQSPAMPPPTTSTCDMVRLPPRRSRRERRRPYRDPLLWSRYAPSAPSTDGHGDRRLRREHPLECEPRRVGDRRRAP